MAISQYGNEYYGLSGDDKPIGTPLNGRKFTEMDTSKEYRFDAENQQWLQQSGGGGGSSTLSGLTDVDISNPTDGQVLVYNAESGKWVNGAGGGASAYFVDCVYNEDTQTQDVTITSSKTAAEIQAAVESGALVYIRYTVPAGAASPAVNHVYPLNSMVYAANQGVTRVRFSFDEMDNTGTPASWVSGFTWLTDTPVFTSSR